MTASVERETAPQAAKSDAGFVERLAERLGINAKAATVYADAVERDGVTVIPVAKVRYGFGGGDGSREGEQGSGGGGGAQVTPIGYIELKDGSSKFYPIKDRATTMRMIFAGIILGSFLLPRLFKSLRS